MTKHLACYDFIRVVVLVRWEQLAHQFVVDIRRCSQIVRKTRRDLQAGQPTLAVLLNRIRNDACNVQVGKQVNLEVNEGHTFRRTSAESFALRFNSFWCLKCNDGEEKPKQKIKN